MFNEVSTKLAFPQREKRILEFWRENDTFRKSVSNREGCPPFVFYEGPPTANGMPTIAHALARVMKDLICRYKTITGHYVVRKAGWDTHGLPVELEVEKASTFGAVERLLLADVTLREASDEERIALERLMREVEQKGGEVTIISAEHEAGAKLLSLGSIAALLRFPLA